MKLTSNSFANAARIDLRHTCEGDDLSPPLVWSGVPNGTKSFALICEDPDAPSAKKPAAEPWVHWIIFNIPADRVELPMGLERKLELVELGTARQGKNSWPSDNVGYRGPAPPPGSGPHRYFFKLYALDCALNLKAGTTKADLVKAMSGHVLAEGELYGTFER